MASAYGDGEYIYTGSYPVDRTDISGVRQIKLSLTSGSYMEAALPYGSIDVQLWLRSADYKITNKVTVTLYDSEGNTLSRTMNLPKFSTTPQQQTLKISHPFDSPFLMHKVTKLTIVDENKSKNIYLSSKTAVVHVYYVFPSHCLPPENVRCEPASVVAGTSILKWDEAQAGDYNPVYGYIVYRATTPDGSYSKIAGTASEPYTLRRLEVESRSGNGNAYYYKVQTIGERKNYDSPMPDHYATLTTEWSNPQPPTNLRLSSTLVGPGDRVVLSWDTAVPGINNPVSYYEVYRQASSDEYEYVTWTHNTDVYVDPPTDVGEVYRYKVKAIGKLLGLDSELSAASADLRSTFTAPSVPQNLQADGAASVIRDPGMSVLLTWDASTDGDQNPLVGYQIELGGEAIGSTTGTQYTVTASLVYNATDVYTVRASGRYGNSQPSASVRVVTSTPPQPPRSNEPINQFLVFDRNDELLYVRDDAFSMRVVEEEFKLSGSMPIGYINSVQPRLLGGNVIHTHTVDPNSILTAGMRIGWLEGDELRMYEIRQPQTNLGRMTQEFEGEHVAISELSDVVTEPRSYQQAGIRSVVADMLSGTDWVVGRVDIESAEPLDFALEYTNVWAALISARDAWGVEIVPRMAYTYDGIERYIDILSRRGEYRGVRLYLDLNAQDAGIIYDDREQYTALYGLGAKQKRTLPDGSEQEYRITFEDVAWSVQDGRPVDKPLGQKWIEDPEATDSAGRKGRPRYGIVEFDDATNQRVLLQATWDALQVMKAPKVTINMTAFDLSTIGYAEQGIALGDDVVVVMDEIGVQMLARVTKFDRDILRPEQSKPTIGDAREDILGKIATASAKNGEQSGGGGGYTLDVDDTLTVPGMAADAAAAGTRITALEDSVPGKQDALKAGYRISLDNNIVSLIQVPEPCQLVRLWSGSKAIGGSEFPLNHPLSEIRMIAIQLVAPYNVIWIHPGATAFYITTTSSARFYHIGGTITWKTVNGNLVMCPAITLRYYDTSYNAGAASSANPSVTAIYAFLNSSDAGDDL